MTSKTHPPGRVGRLFAAIGVFTLICLGLVTWVHLRWSTAQAHTVEQLQALHGSSLRLLRAELIAERLRVGDTTVSPEMLAAELGAARLAADPLASFDVALADLTLPGEVQQARLDAAHQYIGSLEALRTRIRERLGEQPAAPALSLRQAMGEMDQAAMRLEMALHDEQQRRLRRQGQLTALTLLLMSGLAALLMHQLQRSIRAREQARAAQAEHAARLEALAGALPEASFLLDAQGRYEAIYGPPDKLAAPRGELLGLRVSDHLTAEQSTLVLDTIHRALALQRTAQTELSLVTPEGLRRFECRAAPLPGQPLVAWISWDVTERLAAENQVRALTRLYSFLSQVNQAIVQTRSEVELFARICTVALSHGGFVCARIVQSTGAAVNPWLERHAAVTADAGELPQRLRPLADRLAEQALADGHPRWLTPADSGEAPGAEAAPAPEESEVESADPPPPARAAVPSGAAPAAGPVVVALPLACDGPPDAVLLLLHPHLDPHDEDEQRLFEEICTDIGYARSQLRRRAQWQESESRMRLHAAALESTQDGVIVTDLAPRIVSVNRAFTRITGYGEQEVLGRSPSLLRSGRQDPQFYESMWRALKDTGSWQGEMWNRRKNGELFAQWISIAAVADEQGQTGHYVAVFTDITTQKLTEERLQHMAHYDPLTQLPNRPMVLARLEQALASAARQSLHVAVLFIDLDNFKTVNDSLGHAAGDELLTSVAQRLSHRTRREDTLGRLGGDEFVLVLEHLHDPHDAGQVAQELLDLLAEPFLVGDQSVYVQASIGISLYPQDGHSVSDLVRDADAAMYQAKHTGRNTYRYYTESLTAAAQSRLTLDSRLRRALARGEFVLCYQPLHDIASRRIVGLEALVRLNQPELPTVGPAEFVPVLEDSGLIIELGQWVTREACRQGRAWMDAGLDFGRIAINLSPMEVRRGGADERVRAALADTGLPPDRLELEITESGLMEQGERTEGLLHSLHAMGVHLAIDDFGTGYSSLAYLKRFPVRKLKIDRSFIRDLPGDANDAQLVQTMVDLGHSLGMTVLAEGVETAAQQEFLRRIGCEAAQGFLFGAPMSPEAIRQHLSGRAPDVEGAGRAEAQAPIGAAAQPDLH